MKKILNCRNRTVQEQNIFIEGYKQGYRKGKGSDYSIIYITRKRKLNKVLERLKLSSKMKEEVFDKYFTFFKQFVIKNYCTPTTREMNIGVGVNKEDKKSNIFNKELERRLLIKKIGVRYTPTIHLMEILFDIKTTETK